MRGFTIAALVGVAGLAVPIEAAATHSHGAGPKEDFVAGSVRAPTVTPVGTFPSEQHINARAAGPEVPGLGAPAKGWFRVRIDFPFGPEFELRGQVRCINNVGNSSVIRGVITESESPLVPVGLGVTHRYVDNGEGENAVPDGVFGMVTGPPSGGSDCPHVPFPTLPADQGNVVVHDPES